MKIHTFGKDPKQFLTSCRAQIDTIIEDINQKAKVYFEKVGITFTDADSDYFIPDESLATRLLISNALSYTLYGYSSPEFFPNKDFSDIFGLWDDPSCLLDLGGKVLELVTYLQMEASITKFNENIFGRFGQGHEVNAELREYLEEIVFDIGLSEQTKVRFTMNKGHAVNAIVRTVF